MRALSLFGWMTTAVTLVACGNATTEHSSTDEGPVAHAQGASTKLRIGMSPHCSSAPVFAAQTSGELARAGIDAKLVRFDDGKQALAALARGDVDVALAGDIPIPIAALDHPDLSVLGTVSRSMYEDWLVAKTGIATPADLRGKNIGVPRHAGARYVLDAVLVHAGMTEHDVNIKFIGFDQLKTSLMSGEVDAVVVQQPLRESVESIYGPGFEAVTDHDGYHVNVNLVTLRALPTKEPEAIHALLRAVDHGTQAATKDAVKIADAMEKELGKIKPGDDPLSSECSRQKFALTMDLELAHHLQHESGWFKKNEQRDHTFEVGKVLHPEPLAFVKPEAVTFRTGR